MSVHRQSVGDQTLALETWRTSPERRKQAVYLEIMAFLACAAVVGTGLLWVYFSTRYELPPYPTAEELADLGMSRSQIPIPPPWLWAGVFGMPVLALGLGLASYARWRIARGAFLDRKDEARQADLRVARDDVVPEPESELVRLVNANRALLDEYQRPVRAQARTSYVYSQVAILVGLIVLVAGAMIALLATESAARLAVAGLAGIGTALAGYVARTFLRVYERAQEQLNYYFREPLITSYLLTAERLAEKLDGERQHEVYAEMAGEIVRAVRGDLRPPSAQAAPTS